MARPKSTPAPTIQDTISRKIESIKNEIDTLTEQLIHWEKIASDYETNKSTIESILSVHQAPELSEKPVKKYKKKTEE